MGYSHAKTKLSDEDKVQENRMQGKLTRIEGDDLQTGYEGGRQESDWFAILSKYPNLDFSQVRYEMCKNLPRHQLAGMDLVLYYKTDENGSKVHLIEQTPADLEIFLQRYPCLTATSLVEIPEAPAVKSEDKYSELNICGGAYEWIHKRWDFPYMRIVYRDRDLWKALSFISDYNPRNTDMSHFLRRLQQFDQSYIGVDRLPIEKDEVEVDDLYSGSENIRKEDYRKLEAWMFPPGWDDENSLVSTASSLSWISFDLANTRRIFESLETTDKAEATSDLKHHLTWMRSQLEELEYKDNHDDEDPLASAARAPGTTSRTLTVARRLLKTNYSISLEDCCARAAEVLNDFATTRRTLESLEDLCT